MTASYARILRFFRRYIGPSIAENRLGIVASLLLLFVSTALFILALELSRLVIQAVQQAVGDGLAAGLLRRMAGDDAAYLLAGAGLLCIATFSAASLSAYLRDVCFEEIALRLTVRLRKQLFTHLLGTRIVAFRAFESSLLVKRMIQDLGSIRMILVEAMMLRSADAALFVGLLAYLFSLDAALTWFSLSLVACYFAVAEISARLIGPGLYRSDASTEQMTSHLNQSFQRLADIKSNQTEEREGRQFGALADADYAIRKKTIKLLMLDRSVSGWLSSIVPIAITLVGGFWVLRGTMQLDQVLVFVAAVNMLTNAVDRLTEIPMIISRTAVSVQNVEELLLLPQEQRRLPDEVEAAADGPVLEVTGFERKLSEQHRLRIDALEIRAGEKVAVIGPSGCGKSSLFGSALKFDEGYQGSLRLMGLEVGHSGTEAIRSRISYMHQHSMVLPDDVLGNVRYSRSAQAIDDDAARQALRIVHLEDLLEDGETRDPARLSGGQKRRLCLARALYRRAPLLLLDEPLTGVSPAVGKEIVDALLRRPEAVIMVTHQYEELGRFDRVILMEVVETPEGRLTRIAAQDTHESLVASSPGYRESLAHG